MSAMTCPCLFFAWRTLANICDRRCAHMAGFSAFGAALRISDIQEVTAFQMGLLSPCSVICFIQSWCLFMLYTVLVFVFSLSYLNGIVLEVILIISNGTINTFLSSGHH